MKRTFFPIAALWAATVVFPVRAAALPDLSIPSFQILLSTSGPQPTVTFNAQVKNSGSNYFDQASATPVIDHSTTVGVAVGTVSLTNVFSNRWQAQAIVPVTGFTLSRIDLAVYNKGITTDTIRLNFRRDNGGFLPSNSVTDILATVQNNVLHVDSTTPSFQPFSLPSPLVLAAGTTYWLTVESDETSSSNAYGIWVDSGVPVNSLAVNSPVDPTDWSYYKDVPQAAPSELFRKLYRPVDTVVYFYQGNPANGGALIGSSTITLPIEGNASASVTATCGFAGAAALEFYAVVDAPGLVSESDESNNTASGSILSNAARNVFTASDAKTKVTFDPGAAPYGFYSVSIDVAPAATSAVRSANDKSSAGPDRFNAPVLSTLRKVSFFQSSDLTTPVASPRFSGPVTVTIPYDDNGQGFVANTHPPVPAGTLSVYWLNEADGLWVRLPDSTVDSTAKTVTATVPHFSYFILMGMNAPDLSRAYAYPVPFRPAKGHTKIKFTGLSPQCTIKIYTAAGELVKTLHESDGDGFNDDWDGTGAASGTYLYVIDNGAQSKTGQLVIVK